MDLISRQAAIAEIVGLPNCYDSYDKACIIGVLEELPTIDPVKHGKWIEYPIADGMNQCSVCGVLQFGDSNYCSNCGAKMDGEIATNGGEPLPESYKEETDDTEG